MLQSLSGKLNRLNDVRAIGAAIVTELRSLVEYNNCRVLVVDGDELQPIAFRGDLGNPHVGAEALGTRVGEGISGRAAATGESILVPDVLACDFAVPVADTPEVEETVAAVPLRYGARVIGVIVVSKLGADQLDGDDVRLLEVLAGHASVALENARALRGAAARRRGRGRERRGRPRRCSRSAAGSPRPAAWKHTAPCAARGRARAPSMPAARASGCRTARRTLELDRPRSATRRSRSPSASPRMRSPATWATSQAPGPYILERSHLDELGVEPPPGTRYVVAPLVVEQRRGVLALAIEAGTRNEARMLRLLTGRGRPGGARHDARVRLGGAREHVRLDRRGARQRPRGDRQVALDARTPGSRTCPGARRGARHHGDDVRRLEYAALFHDIGKIGVPDDVLLKPGRSRTRSAVVERHPEIGERILRPVDRLGEVAPHRRAPATSAGTAAATRTGLRGEEIPLGARIIFVCDAYHAMITDRPYRAALPPDEARQRLQEAAGTQFDPRAVEAFLCLDVPGSLD